MPIFVHLTSEKNIKSIRRTGIRQEVIHCVESPKGIFCMPVIGDFYATHQWARELIRFGLRNPYAVYFRLPDNEPVWYGRYNNDHRKMTASEALNIFAGEKDQMGFQVILPRKVLPNEIVKFRSVPPLGWRFSPSAKGTKPCLCPICISRGEYGSHKLFEQKLDEYYKDFCHAKDTKQKSAALCNLASLIEDHRLEFKRWPNLMQEEVLSDSSLFEEVVRIAIALKNKKAV